MSIPPRLQPVFDELLPLLRALGEGACAVSIGGSYGKGTFDSTSDLDFRVFCECRLAPEETYRQAYARLQAAMDRWTEKGITVDMPWIRTVVRSTLRSMPGVKALWPLPTISGPSGATTC